MRKSVTCYRLLVSSSAQPPIQHRRFGPCRSQRSGPAQALRPMAKPSHAQVSKNAKSMALDQDSNLGLPSSEVMWQPTQLPIFIACAVAFSSYIINTLACTLAFNPSVRQFSSALFRNRFIHLAGTSRLPSAQPYICPLLSHVRS